MAGRSRSKFNDKRRIMAEGHGNRSKLAGLLERVRYSGHPGHKRNPGDFGLTPPSAPNPKKTLCDRAGIHSRKEALSRLKAGLKRGLVCGRWMDGWPRHIWSVAGDGVTVLEAKRDGKGSNSYHGYPLRPADPIAEEVLRRWAHA